MSFWNKVKAVAVGTYEGAKTAWKSGSITEGYRRGKDAYNEAYAHYESMKRKEVTWSPTPPDEPKGPYDDPEEEKRRQDKKRKEELRLQRLEDEAARKALLAKRQKMIDSFHENYGADATMYEIRARRIYEETYESLLQELSKIMDVNPIRSFIQEQSKSFDGIMRNEVNSKVSLGNHEMVAIMNDESLDFEQCEKELNKYVNEVFDNARINLLDRIQKSIDLTNGYIKEISEAFLKDEVELLSSNVQMLKELSKKGARRDAELRKIAEQQITLSYIQALANKKD